MTGQGTSRGSLEEACDEHERLTRALASVREEQERLLTAILEEEIAPRLAPVARDVGFAMNGVRARGLLLERDEPHASLFVVVEEDVPWALVERHANGFSAVPKRVTVSALLDAFGRESGAVLRAALVLAETAAAHASGRSDPAEPAPPRVPSSPHGARAPSRVPLQRAEPVRPARPTRPCPACTAQPNEENFARHLRIVHGLDPAGHRVKSRAEAAGARHQECRLCGARLPAGRLDPHLTAVHGIFHVHPAGDHGDPGDVRARDERRREASRTASRRGLERPLPRPAKERTKAAPPSGGRDFLAETRHERTLVARADSPERNRDREGRFSDAPDVERMDGDSNA
ncbi:MAG: hypothetical protein JWP97_783 [Labilithrix sp.]|nr:hypothetical protein [Labilithrix sp.]